ncbi:MAG TPA: SHOCT domain-containing protein [Sunxiuqinia sp.]|nr:SHOCT domain-containing protein [Sunxiuqinia sp.]
MHGFNGMGYGMNWGMGFGWIIGLALLVLVVWAIVKLVNNNNTNYSPSDNKQKTALQILKERFAKGEIDKQEFEDKKRAILE